MTWYHWVVYTHVMSAMLWVGGMFFISLVAVPAARDMDLRRRTTLMSTLGRRFRDVGWVLLALLWVTGAVQMWIRGATWSNILDGSFFTTRFGSLMGSKLLIILVMMVVSALHDWVIGPRAAAVAEAGGDPERLRRIAAWLGRINALLALGIVGHAVVMVR
nr:copper resistance protein CopD [Bacillota bacterium]